MGYTTDFDGGFTIDRPVDEDTYALLHGLATTRRMRRSIRGYGVDGEYYVDAPGYGGQAHTPDIIDYNKPPRTQPGLWCGWLIQPDRQTIKWDGGEKFYRYVEWLEYIIGILKNRKYKVNGTVEWFGEELDDRGIIRVSDNTITIDE